jgi:PEP-CTERM motif
MMKQSGLAIIACGVLATPALAENHTLQFANLPSAQGWAYAASGDGASLPETSAFAATGSSLLQTTIGVGQTQGGQNIYYRPTTVVNGRYTLNLRATVSASEGLALGGGTNYPFGLTFGVSYGNGYDAIGLSGSRFSYFLAGAGSQVIYFDKPAGFDASASNLYTLTGNNGLFSFAVNGTTLISNALSQSYDGGPYLLLGDGTGFGNANATVTQLEFRSGVPEAATWAMMIAGFGAVGVRARRRRRVIA